MPRISCHNSLIFGFVLKHPIPSAVLTPDFQSFSDGTTISIFGGKITPFWTVPKFSLDPWSMAMLCYTCIYLYIHNIHSMYVCIALHCIVFCHIILHRIYIIYTCIQYMYTHIYIHTHRVYVYSVTLDPSLSGRCRLPLALTALGGSTGRLLSISIVMGVPLYRWLVGLFHGTSY